MNAFLKKWGGTAAAAAVVLIALGVLGWRSWHVPEWDVEALMLSEERETLPGLELMLDAEAAPFGVTLLNGTDMVLESGASVGSDPSVLIFTPGLDVLLDGRWYDVPCKDGASAGVGLTLGLGEAVSGRGSLDGYGRLPDGEYRAVYGAYPPGERVGYGACARFWIEGGRVVV